MAKQFTTEDFFKLVGRLVASTTGRLSKTVAASKHVPHSVSMTIWLLQMNETMTTGRIFARIFIQGSATVRRWSTIPPYVYGSGRRSITQFQL